MFQYFLVTFLFLDHHTSSHGLKVNSSLLSTPPNKLSNTPSSLKLSSGGGTLLKRKKSTDSSDVYLGQDMGDDSCDDTSSQEARRKKKARTTFTGRQIFELEKQFEIKKYLSSSERAEMAKLLNVTETQVSELFKIYIN